MERPTTDSERTIREDEARTLLGPVENTVGPFETDGSSTIRYDAPLPEIGAKTRSVSIGGWTTFRGCPILEQLPTSGAEADLYLLQTETERCVLKLYRHRLEPKLEVLNRIGEISRNNSRCFVVFRDAGFDEQTGRWYEIQEYISLGSLRNIPEQIKRKPDFIRKLVSELTEAIHCLHCNGIVHRDIKPANVLVRSLDPLDLVLTDFGISSLLASDMSQRVTSLKGTPMYWAPEAFSRIVGRPCDWWGLGMMVLELLAGAHPLEGLSDSRIIHKLTMGNIEIPQSIDPDFRRLLKGLLTKNDAKRWGYEEAVRWILGDGNIPVHYVEPSEHSAEGERGAGGRIKPFRFEGKDYFSTKELALAFCADEKPWRAGQNYLRYIRQWLESNMRFDEAVELGNMIGKADSEHAIFRFVHKNAECPFIFLGKLIDVNNLHLFTGRVVRREASGAECKIVEMMGNGQLLSLYREYLSYSGNEDPFLHRVLIFMDMKNAAEQWGYFEAVHNPDEFLWPEDGNRNDASGTFETLKRMETVPLKRDFLERLQKRHVLPKELLSLFRSTATYASAAAQLADLEKRDLLIPRGTDPYSSLLVENLNLEDYIKKAWIQCMGHTSAMTAKLDFLLEAFPQLPFIADSLQSEMVSRTLGRLQKLKNAKITAIDALFIGKAADLFNRRLKMERARVVRYPIAATVSGLLLWVARILTGSISTMFFRLLFVAVPVAVVSYFMINGRWLTEESLRRSGRQDPRLLLIVLAVYVPVMIFDESMEAYPNFLPFAIGALIGCAVYFFQEYLALSRSITEIADACASYCTSLRQWDY